jgi:hypothetical protein
MSVLLLDRRCFGRLYIFSFFYFFTCFSRFLLLCFFWFRLFLSGFFLLLFYLFLQVRQPQKAAEAYRNYSATNYAKSPWGQSEALPYLIESGQHRKAIAINRNAQKLFEGQDTINNSYLIVLDRFARSYRGL